MGRHTAPDLLPQMPKIPDIHGVAVGLAAVEMINLGDWYDEKASRLHQSGDTQGSSEATAAASRVYEKVPPAFDKVREAIARVPDDPAYRAYVRNLSARTSSAYNGRRANVLEWLTNKDQGASDSELLDVSNQQLLVLAEQQHSPNVIQAIETEKGKYATAVHQGVREGWLSKHSLSSLGVISHTRVYVGDIWSTRLKGWLAYRPHGKNEMIVAQSINPNEESWGQEVAQEIEKSGWHEFRHIHANDMWLPRWIKEPAAEYSSLSLRFGYSDKLVDFETRPIDEIHYMNEMALWDTLLQRGNQVLEGRLLLRAHSSEGPHSQEWDELDSALDASWGVSGVRHRVGEFIERTEATVSATNPDWSEAQFQKEAVRLVEDILFKNPEVIFGSEHQTTKPRAGALALRDVAH